MVEISASKSLACESLAELELELVAAPKAVVSDARMASWFIVAVFCTSASEAIALARMELSSVGMVGLLGGTTGVGE